MALTYPKIEQELIQSQISSPVTFTGNISSLPSVGVQVSQLSDVKISGNTVNVIYGESTEKTFPTGTSNDTIIKTGLYLPAGKYLLFYTITQTGTVNTRNTPLLYGTTYQYESSLANNNTTVGKKVWKVETTETKTQLKWWGNTLDIETKVKDFMIIPANDAAWAKTTTQLLTEYRFSPTGIVSTLSERLKSVGKNLLSINDYEIGYILTTNGENDDTYSTRIRSKKYYKIKANTQYWLQQSTNATEKLLIYYYDNAKKFISYKSTGSGISEASLTPSNAVYFRWSFTKSYIESLSYNLMIFEGTNTVPYEPYTETTAYTPSDIILRSLLNGVKDEFRGDGTKIQRNKAYVLQASDLVGLTSSQNVDVILTRVFDDYIGGTYNPDNNYIIDGFPELQGNDTIYDFVSNVGKSYSRDDKRFRMLVAKGTYANLSSAQTALTGTSVNYQLSTPIITKYPPQTLIGYPNGTLIVDNAIQKFATYTATGIAITNTNAPIKEIESIIKTNSDGTETTIDLATVTIATDKLSFTSTALAENDKIKFVYLYDSSLSTIPTIEYKYSMNIKAVLENNTKTIATHSALLRELILKSLQ